MNLLKEAGIKVNPSKRTLLVQASNFPLEVLYLRDDDIPQTVASGVADLGVVGENEFVEKQEKADVVKRLGFSKCRLSLAIPKAIDYKGVEWFEGKKIATSYPEILKSFMKEKGINVDIHVIQGSVEIAPGICLADGIFDIVGPQGIAADQFAVIARVVSRIGFARTHLVKDHGYAPAHQLPDGFTAGKAGTDYMDMHHSLPRFVLRTVFFLGRPFVHSSLLQ